MLSKFSQLLDKPENVILIASNTNPMNGAGITLHCSSAARPAAKYRFFWLKNSVMTEISSNGSGSILISDINYVDFGGFHVTYKCIPHNILGSGPSAYVQLHIQGTTSKPVYTGFKSTTKTSKGATTRRTDIKDFGKAVPLESSKLWIHLGYSIVIVILVSLVIFLIVRDRRNKKKEVIPEPKVESTFRRDANSFSTEMHYMELANREKTREPTYATLTDSTYEELQKPTIFANASCLT